MAKQARMRPSWKKWTKKSKKRDRELYYLKPAWIRIIGGVITNRDAVNIARSLHVFERAQKKLAKLYDPDVDMIRNVINGSGIGLDEEMGKGSNRTELVDGEGADEMHEGSV
jgi:hypothetical protein